MHYSYKYVDLDFTYTDPKTGILRNLADITEPDVLLFFESEVLRKPTLRLYSPRYPLKHPL